MRLSAAMLKVRTAKPLARFRVYVWPPSLYFVVHVWRTKKDMLDNRVAVGLPRSRDTEAHVFSYDQFRFYSKREKKPRRKRPIVGEMNFYRDRLGTEVITHECFHATASLLRRFRFDFGGLSKEGVNSKSRNPYLRDPEELVASIIGKLSRAIVTQLYERALIVMPKT